MDKKYSIELEKLLELEFSEEDLTSELEGLSIEEIYEFVANSPPLAISPPLRPNQTISTEKISIRIPRYILEYFRDLAKNKGVGYQTLINTHLNEVFRKQ